MKRGFGDFLNDDATNQFRAATVLVELAEP